MARSWRGAVRSTLEEGWPPLLPWNQDAADIMAEVRLVGDDSRIPEHALAAWFGVAVDRREAGRERWRRWSQRQKAGATGANRQSVSPSVSKTDSQYVSTELANVGPTFANGTPDPDEGTDDDPLRGEPDVPRLRRPPRRQGYQRRRHRGGSPALAPGVSAGGVGMTRLDACVDCGKLVAPRAPLLRVPAATGRDLQRRPAAAPRPLASGLAAALGRGPRLRDPLPLVPQADAAPRGRPRHPVRGATGPRPGARRTSSRPACRATPGADATPVCPTSMHPGVSRRPSATASPRSSRSSTRTVRHDTPVRRSGIGMSCSPSTSSRRS